VAVSELTQSDVDKVANERMIIMETKTLEIQVQRMYRFESDRPLKAFADIIINDALLIKGIKVLEGKNGLFVSMPQEQAKDKKWYDSVRCLTQGAREQVTEAVLSVYKEG
jgi:stage V sporulation protein G